MSMSINGDVLLSLVRVRRVILRRLVGSLIVGATMMKQLPLLSCAVLCHSWLWEGMGQSNGMSVKVFYDVGLIGMSVMSRS